MPYPTGTSDILPGNLSFAVVAAAGASSGAVRIDHQGGNWDNVSRTSEYGASDSAYVRDIVNKFKMIWTCTVAEGVTALESVVAMGNRLDIYVKRSSGATTYDKLADCTCIAQPKDVPESGDAHRTVTLTFSGGTYTAAVAANTVPTLAP